MIGWGMVCVRECTVYTTIATFVNVGEIGRLAGGNAFALVYEKRFMNKAGWIDPSLLHLCRSLSTQNSLPIHTAFLYIHNYAILYPIHDVVFLPGSDCKSSGYVSTSLLMHCFSV